MNVAPLPLLPVRVNPKRREGPRHYLMRLATANGHSVRDLLKLGYDYGRQFLPWFEFVDTEPLQPKYVQPIQSLWESNKSVWLRSTGRVCPLCLAEKVFEDTVGWELRHADACCIHECWLVDRCECGLQLKPYRDDIAHCECGRSLANLPTQCAPFRVVELARRVVHLATSSLDVIPRGSDTDRVTNPSGLDLSDLQKLVHVLGVYGRPRISPAKTGIVANETMAESWQVTSLASESLHAWPVGFHRTLEWIRLANDNGTPHSLIQRFGSLYHQIYKVLDGEEFDFLRQTFDTYLAEHWPTLFIRKNSRRTPLRHLEKQWLSVKQASQRANVSLRTIRTWVTEGLIVSDARVTASGRSSVLIKTSSFESHLRRRIAHHDMDFTEARELLGLPKMRFRRIVQQLFPEAQKGVDLTWRIPVNEVTRLQELAKKARPMDYLKDDQSVTTINAALKYHRLSDAGLVWLLNEMRSRRLPPPTHYLEPDSRIGSWIISMELIVAANQAAAQAELKVLDTGIKLPDLARRWNVKQEVIYRLANDGALKTVSVDGSVYRGRIVPMQDVAAFESSYVALKQLAVQCATSPRWLKGQLSTAGVEPAFGPTQNGCRQLFYLRSECLHREIQKCVSRITRRVAHPDNSVLTDYLSGDEEPPN